MAIYDKDGNLLSYARKRPSMKELGGTGRSYAQRFQQQLATDEYLSTLQFPYDIPIYEKMSRSDGQVKAMLLMLSLPIRATEWFVRPKDDSEESKKIANFIEDSLFGGFGVGLQTGFDEFIKDVTTMFQYGHSIFEKIFEVRNGKIKWKKFAVRPQSTIYDMYYDDVGDFKGIDQYMIHNNWKTVYIPVERLLVFSHDMQQGNIRGTSVLRSAYKHWTIKDFLYKITNVGIERNFVGTPVLNLPEGYTQEDKELADEIVTTLRSSEFGGARLPDGFELSMFEGKRTLADVMPIIEHHDRLMSKSIVAGFMDLGSGNSTSGSFALSSDQSQMFLMMLDASAKNICNICNIHAIPELVRYNFDSDLFPELAFKPMNSTKVINTLKTLVDGKIVLPDDDLEGYIRDMLDLPDANPVQSREEVVEQFKQNQIASIESKQPSENTKSKNPIDNNSKQKQYTDKIKDDNVNKKMSENSIDYVNLPEVHLQKLEDIIKRQLIYLNEKSENEDINNLSKIRINLKSELSREIRNILKTHVKLDESNVKFDAKCNIISNSISETVKSMFLNKFIDGNTINFNELCDEIMNNL